MDQVIVVSSDSHAQMPPEVWPEYVEKRYHDFLPGLHEEAVIYPRAMWLLSAQVMTLPEVSREHRVGGFRGVHDAGVRVAEMDREGIAAELVYHGDFRSTDTFHNIINRKCPFEVWDAGVAAYDRWAFDTFGAAKERFLLVSAVGPCTDLDASLAELAWISDHGFVGTFVPGFMTHPDMPPLFDEYWEPFWSWCEERELALVVHAGFGWEQGFIFPEVERIYKQVESAGGSDLELLSRLASEVFTGEFFSDLRPRRPMWQLMLGGVFDRHPDLKLIMSEVRVDWIPATLRHLDALFDDHHADLPAKQRPSDYWRSNCLAGASFVHKAEVEMRHELGVETVSFGRDYPHPEGTWPNTKDWLRDAFAGVPDDEVRLMLGENAIRFLRLDRAPLPEIAGRIGPAIDEITSPAPAIEPELLANFDIRGGYLRPAEGDAKLAAIDPMLREDLVRAGASVGAE